jgi:PEP-CTERM motif
MREFALAVMAFVVMPAFPRICDAGTITYSIQNYPADQNGASLSGTITTDGTIGNLASSDILSWSWTITPLGGTPFTLTSSDPDSITNVLGSLVASASEITIAVPVNGGAETNDLTLENAGGIGSLEYSRESGGSVYFGYTASNAPIWFTGNPSMGGTDPWVIATASVPEPSTITLAGLGAVVGLLHGLARKRRARCKVASS